MNNEMAPILDILEELKQECKAISKTQAELRTTLATQPASPNAERTTTQEIVQIHLSKETQAKIKDYSLFASVQLTERILLGLVCGLVMVSCWFFAMGANQLQTASDYDLRYRYLRMQGKATSNDFAHLDSLFITYRNPKAIQQMQQKIADYEQALQRQTELLLQQKRIAEEQGELKKHLKK